MATAGTWKRTNHLPAPATVTTNHSRAKEPLLDHDHLKENWSRRTNKYCDCPAWRYNPRHPKPTNPECEMHAMASTSQPPRRDLYEIEVETKAAAERLFSSPDKDEE